MSPKEKAEELVLKFKELPQEETMMFYLAFEISKQCALIAVDEILSDYKNYLMHENTEYKGLMYWQEVKKEIELL
jgi:hypothetical protein